jgi:hypothetical protein
MTYDKSDSGRFILPKTTGEANGAQVGMTNGPVAAQLVYDGATPGAPRRLVVGGAAAGRQPGEPQQCVAAAFE